MGNVRKTRLILASASPRRSEILRDAGFEFAVRPCAVDESLRPGETPAAHVARLAREKARAGASGLAGPAVVIGADTVVVLGREILGKPASRDHARRMLRLLSGRTHRVLTGVAVLLLPPQKRRVARRRGRIMQSGVEVTRVTFAPLSRQEIDNYIATGEPDDKAGAYAVQGRGGRFVTRIEGCYFNVVGLPLARLYRMLLKLGIREAGSKHKRRPESSGRRKRN
jgi:nucleoside triphosphate pyrophosphatase